MHYSQLSPHQTEPSHDLERSEEAKIAGEIARHLIDYSEATSKPRTTHFIRKLNALASIKPEGEVFWVVCAMLTGDLSEITKSYQEIGKSMGKSKQGHQQRLEMITLALEIHFPELAKAVIELRHLTAEVHHKPTTKHEDPI